MDLDYICKCGALYGEEGIGGRIDDSLETDQTPQERQRRSEGFPKMWEHPSPAGTPLPR